jgi:hypothetical protein
MEADQLLVLRQTQLIILEQPQESTGHFAPGVLLAIQSLMANGLVIYES